MLTYEGRKYLKDMLQVACNALGLVDCPMHADVIFRDGNEKSPHLIELSGRPSGLHLSAKMLPHLTGTDYISEAFSMAGLEVSEAHPHIVDRKHHETVWLGFFDFPPGIFRGIDGLLQVRQAEGVLSADCFLNPEDRIPGPQTGQCGFRTGYICTAGRDSREARALWNWGIGSLRFKMDFDN
jgi:hypothetical protein